MTISKIYQVIVEGHDFTDTHMQVFLNQIKGSALVIENTIGYLEIHVLNFKDAKLLETALNKYIQ